MWKRRGASPDPCRTPILRRSNLLRLPLAVVRVRLRLSTSSMNKRTTCLSGSDRSNVQVKAALTAVPDAIYNIFFRKESVWFIILSCFFTVGSVKFLQLSFVIFAGRN